MGSSQSNYSNKHHTMIHNVGADGKLNYPSKDCFEGHGKSHNTRSDILHGTNVMNNFNDDSGYAIGAQILQSNGPYHAAAENIVGGCPDPSAHCK